MALARDVVDREPVDVFDPPGFCGRTEGREDMIPVIHSKTDTKVYLWVKVESPVAGTLRHSWYMAGMRRAPVTLGDLVLLAIFILPYKPNRTSTLTRNSRVPLKNFKTPTCPQLRWASAVPSAREDTKKKE